MGRRKIEIKAIKDDRNRSVTFLKRKGGLFKKAHELSVLCSVDVAVIIFGANKKLHQFSSGNIQEIIERHQYYGSAHEHKGPADFQGKRDGDGSEDEDVDDAALEEQMSAPPPDHLAHMQGQPGYPPQIRHAASASPPMGNGAPMGYHPRSHTPQPAGVGSRPTSRNMIQRPNSNLGQHRPPPHGPQVPNGYTSYLQQQGPYQPPHPQQQGPQPPPGSQAQPQAQHQHGLAPPPHGPNHPAYAYSQAPAQAPPSAQMHPQYSSHSYRPGDNRGPSPQPPGHHHQQGPQPQPPPPPSQSPPQHEHHQPPQRSDLLQVQQPQPKPLTVKSKSIFTPIDDNRSILAGAWGFGDVKAETPIKQEHMSKFPGLGDSASARSGGGSAPAPPGYSQPQRTTSTASLSGEKRPNLKLQIPSEPESDAGGATGSAIENTAVSSPKPAHGGGGGDRGGTDRSGAGGSGPGGGAGGSEPLKASGVVLPPPSPSASALLSAGAQGPPNPFARPLPPNSGPSAPGASNASGGPNAAAYSGNANLDTPMSALPSRVLGDQFLPSPSSFYPEWGFGSANGGRSAGAEGNMLPSPLNWQTPVAGQGPGFNNEKDEEGRKREREGGEEGDAKRVRA